MAFVTFISSRFHSRVLANVASMIPTALSPVKAIRSVVDATIRALSARRHGPCRSWFERCVAPAHCVVSGKSADGSDDVADDDGGGRVPIDCCYRVLEGNCRAPRGPRHVGAHACDSKSLGAPRPDRFARWPGSPTSRSRLEVTVTVAVELQSISTPSTDLP